MQEHWFPLLALCLLIGHVAAASFDTETLPSSAGGTIASFVGGTGVLSDVSTMAPGEEGDASCDGQRRSRSLLQTQTQTQSRHASRITDSDATAPLHAEHPDVLATRSATLPRAAAHATSLPAVAGVQIAVAKNVVGRNGTSLAASLVAAKPDASNSGVVEATSASPASVAEPPLRHHTRAIGGGSSGVDAVDAADAAATTTLLALIARLRGTADSHNVQEGVVFLHVGAMALVIVVALTLVIFAAYKVAVDNGNDEHYGLQEDMMHAHYQRDKLSGRAMPAPQTRTQQSPVFPSRSNHALAAREGLTRSPKADMLLPEGSAAANSAVRGPGLASAGSPSVSAASPAYLSSPAYLCPGLVVPQGNECFLAVPTLAAVGLPLKDRATFDVADLHGQPVVRVEVAPPDWSGTSMNQHHLVVLRVVSSSSELLAYCEVGAVGGRSVRIFSAGGELFATVARSDPAKPRYVLTTTSGNIRLAFEGNFAFATVVVTDEYTRERLADTEPCRAEFDSARAYYKLRAASCVDVGVVLCGLLAIDHMEGS